MRKVVSEKTKGWGLITLLSHPRHTAREVLHTSHGKCELSSLYRKTELLVRAVWWHHPNVYRAPILKSSCTACLL